MSQFSKIIRSTGALGIAAVLCSVQLASAQDGNAPQTVVVPANATQTVIQVPVAPVTDAAGNVILPATGLRSEAGIFALASTFAAAGILGAISSGDNSTTTTTTNN